jgi:hypothetical protein
MSQIGMQMPGGRINRGPTLNVYTGLLLMAVVCLAVACGFMYNAASKLGKGGDAFSPQEVGKIDLK